MFRTENRERFFRQSTIRFQDLRNLNPYNPVLDNVCFFHSKTDFVYDSHVHDRYEIIISVDKPYSCFLNGSRVDMPRDSLIILQPEDQHQDILEEGEDFLVITFYLETRDPQYKKEKIFRTDVNSKERVCHFQAMENADKIMELIKLQVKSKSPNAYYVLNGLFQAFFWSVIPSFPQQVMNPFFISNSYQEYFKGNLFQVFNDNLFGKINVSGIARSMNLSVRSLERNCRKVMGMSPAKAFKEYKLLQVEKYVRHSQFSMSEISEKFGFENQFHFSRIFKKQFGKSPLQYRIHKQEYP